MLKRFEQTPEHSYECIEPKGIKVTRRKSTYVLHGSQEIEYDINEGKYVERLGTPHKSHLQTGTRIGVTGSERRSRMSTSDSESCPTWPKVVANR